MSTLDTFVYILSLFVCISLGSYYKNIDNSDVKRNYGVGLGIICAVLICGLNVIHTIIMVWGNIIIIKCCTKKVIHQTSLIFTWSYLTYLHFYYAQYEYLIYVNQIVALRLVGLAFEIYITDKQGKVDPRVSLLRFPGESDVLSVDPTPTEIMSYALFFIGLHKGPYYRYKVFVDHFNTPFSNLGDCRVISEHKLKRAALCGLALVVLKLMFSTHAYYEDSFYKYHGSDYRYLYNIPQLVMFFLKCQGLMLLCTSVSTECAFGMYPSKCQPTPGFGPSTNFVVLNTASSASSQDAAYEQEYNFAMLKCYSNSKLILGPKMGDTVRSWEMPTRYWFWAYTLKSLVKGNHQVRSACSFLAWTIWCGPSIRLAIMSATMWIYVHLEKEYCELYEIDVDGSIKQSWDIGLSIMRILCLIYLTPCVVVSDTSVVLRYYNSIYWAYHVVLIFLLIASVVLFKMKQKERAVVSVGVSVERRVSMAPALASKSDKTLGASTQQQ